MNYFVGRLQKHLRFDGQMHRYVRYTFLAGFMAYFLFAGCSNTSQEPLGSKTNPIRIYFTPSVDVETIATNAETFIKLLGKETGYYFSTAVPTSYIVVVEAFGSKRADIACMNSFGYFLANQKYGAQALLRIVRYGEDTYRGQIITHINSGINSIEDINGKKFAFTDASSTSGYLLPLKIFKEKNVNLGEVVFGMRHDSVVTMVYQRQVDAGATFHSPPDIHGRVRDARIRVATQFPDVLEKVKIIALTETVPNDPFVFRKDLPEEIKQKVVKGIMNVLKTEEGKSVFYNIYAADGVIPTKDKDYDGLRRLIKRIGKDAEEMIAK